MSELLAVRFMPGSDQQVYRQDGIPDITAPGWTFVEPGHAKILKNVPASIHPGSGPKFQIETPERAREIVAQEEAEQRAAATGRPERPGQNRVGSKLALDPAMNAANELDGRVAALAADVQRQAGTIQDQGKVIEGLTALLAKHGVPGFGPAPAEAPAPVLATGSGGGDGEPRLGGRSGAAGATGGGAGKAGGANAGGANGGGKAAKDAAPKPGDKIGGGGVTKVDGPDAKDTGNDAIGKPLAGGDAG